jgi:hypothetical protein
LPKREHDAPGWRAAIKALMLVVETGGPTNDGTHRRNARAARGLAGVGGQGIIPVLYRAAERGAKL